MNSLDEGIAIINNTFSCACAREVNGNRFPSVNHCLGFDKLLGWDLGYAIAYEFKEINDEKSDVLCLLSGLLRSYVVVDDYKNDLAELASYNCIDKGLANLKIIIENILFRELNINLELYHSIWTGYCSSLDTFNPAQIFSSVKNKCSLISVLFSANDFLENPPLMLLHDYLYKYLFCLQLVDDFQDMEEDRSCRRNHNIFLNCLSSVDVDILIARKVSLLHPLLSYLMKAITEMLDVDNIILKKYMERSILWLTTKINEVDFSGYEVFFGHVEKFSIDVHQAVQCLLKMPTKSVNVSDIRAENMHTQRIMHS